MQAKCTRNRGILSLSVFKRNVYAMEMRCTWKPGTTLHDHAVNNSPAALSRLANPQTNIQLVPLFTQHSFFENTPMIVDHADRANNDHHE